MSKTTYASSGVDTSAARRAIEMFRKHVHSTNRPEVVGDLGGFAGAFALGTAGYKDPLLVSSTDGAGTKVMIAQQLGVHDTVGIDLVAMSVNDVASHGAAPLFFLDYIVIDKVIENVVSDIVKGVATGCVQAGCALLGGEIAEHPGHMHEGSYDLAGFCVGVVERSSLVTGASIASGDVVIGVGSSGVHSNGFSLLRQVLLNDSALKLNDTPDGFDCTLAEELLKPTLIYSGLMQSLCTAEVVKGLAHITGGGIVENLPRMLPRGLQVVVSSDSWDRAPIFDLVERLGEIERLEMFSTFNMGVGMAAYVDQSNTNDTLDLIRTQGFRAFEMGQVIQFDGPQVQIS